MVTTVLALAAAQPGCQQERVETTVRVSVGATFEERVAIARRFAEPQAIRWLHHALRERMPGVQDDQLSALYLGWRVAEFHSLTGRGVTREVLVVVGLRRTKDTADAGRILEGATVLVQGALASDLQSVGFCTD